MYSAHELIFYFFLWNWFVFVGLVGVLCSACDVEITQPLSAAPFRPPNVACVAAICVAYTQNLLKTRNGSRNLLYDRSSLLSFSLLYTSFVLVLYRLIIKRYTRRTLFTVYCLRDETQFIILEPLSVNCWRRRELLRNLQTTMYLYNIFTIIVQCTLYSTLQYSAQ